jgi:hypothetical protein
MMRFLLFERHFLQLPNPVPWQSKNPDDHRDEDDEKEEQTDNSQIVDPFRNG